MNKNITISITAGTVVKTLLILVAAWALLVLHHLVLIVLTAIVIASAIEPGVLALQRRFVPRIVSVLGIYLVIFSVFFIIFYFFLPLLLEDIATFVSSLPNYLDAFNRAGAFDQYAQILGVPAPSAISAADIMANVRDALSLGSTYSSAFGAAAQIFGGVFSFVLIIVFSFYFAVIGTGVDDVLRVVVPRKNQPYVLGLWRRSQTKIGLWMQGQLILAFIMGILVYLLLMVFSVPHALVLALIAGVFEVIPVFGPLFAAVPAVSIAFVSGGPSLGIVVIVIYFVVQQFESNLLYPHVVKRVVGVPPLLVIIALIVGGELAGFLGILLSVPLAGTIQELAHDIEHGVLFPEAEEVNT